MRTTSILLLALTLVFAACSDDATTPPTAISLGGDTTATIQPPPPTTTTAPATTLAPATTMAPATTAAPATTLAPATTMAPTTTPVLPFYTVDPSDFFPDPFPGSDLAHGSGCVTDAQILGDGVWFGFAEAVVGGVISFDLACFWTGAAAEAEAIADGSEAFDFYIRNQNPKTYDVQIPANADVYWIDPTAAEWPWPIPIPPTAWPNPASFLSCPSQWCSVWLYVNGGQATGIVEQYLP